VSTPFLALLQQILEEKGKGAIFISLLTTLRLRKNEKEEEGSAPLFHFHSNLEKKKGTESTQTFNTYLGGRGKGRLSILFIPRLRDRKVEKGRRGKNKGRMNRERFFHLRSGWKRKKKERGGREEAISSSTLPFA